MAGGGCFGGGEAWVVGSGGVALGGRFGGGEALVFVAGGGGN